MLNTNTFYRGDAEGGALSYLYFFFFSINNPPPLVGPRDSAVKKITSQPESPDY